MNVDFLRFIANLGYWSKNIDLNSLKFNLSDAVGIFTRLKPCENNNNFSTIKRLYFHILGQNSPDRGNFGGNFNELKQMYASASTSTIFQRSEEIYLQNPVDLRPKQNDVVFVHISSRASLKICSVALKNRYPLNVSCKVSRS